MEAAIKAIAEPRRRDIPRFVSSWKLAADQIAAPFDVMRPVISQHLTVLKEANLVSERWQGTRRLDRARPAGFEPLRAFLEGFRDRQLDFLREEAARDAETRGGESTVNPQ